MQACDFEDKVGHYIRAEELVEEGQTVGVAVSGGADSMALLVCLEALSGKLGFGIHVLHLEHGIRGEESLGDAAFVAAFCEEHNIACTIWHTNVPEVALKNGIGTELAARKAREAFFSREIQKGTADVVATAHHMGDNAESVLLHLMRGCGLDGLCGIRPRREFFIRPFLKVKRSEIRAYLEEMGVLWREDATNEDTEYDRNWVRRTLLPEIEHRYNPSVVKALARLSDLASKDAAYLDAAAEAAFSDCLVRSTNRSVSLDGGFVTKLHPAIASRVLRKALELTGRGTDVEEVHIEALLQLAKEGRTGARTLLGGGVQGRTEYGKLVVEYPVSSEPFEVPFSESGITKLPLGGFIEVTAAAEQGSDGVPGYIEYVDADKLPRDLVVRTRRAGDRIRPLGASGRRKLKDYFIDRKLPRPERDRVPLLATESNILWITGIILSDDVRIDDKTTRLCRLAYVPE